MRCVEFTFKYSIEEAWDPLVTNKKTVCGDNITELKDKIDKIVERINKREDKDATKDDYWDIRDIFDEMPDNSPSTESLLIAFYDDQSLSIDGLGYDDIEFTVY